ncbi:MAG: DNA polymerase III subunit alpha [Sedimentisphaerales bacterium]|nr:DNA polymerase III subunit alpha [Sedimentisphaerales bacterium]
MADKGFTHLHLHTQYSLLDGAIALGKLFGRCRELGMDSVAITDHGNLFGAVDFYTRAQAAQIKPILGIEAYIAPHSRFDKAGGGGVKEHAYHLILLAENRAGYRNLMKLSSIGFTEGFYYRPRIDKQVLAELSEGIICTTACVAGEVPAALVRGDETAARQAVESYLKIFGEDRFFIEVQHHEKPEGDDLPDVREPLIDLAAKMGIGLIVTNDVHFLNADDYEAHNALCCISTGKLVTDQTRMVYPPDVYLKSPAEMRQMFADIPEACDNTLAIAQRCNVELDLTSRHAPVYVPPDKSTPEAYLTRLVKQGAKQRYGKVTPQIQERIDRELEVIEGKGFSSYFLIVWDFCNFARENNIPVGARGSAVGTVVGYCLGICDVDPIQYDLLFERFMDPERNEMPDIDIDICQDGRARVLEYVRQKYGEIAQIITFGTMKAKAVIRDVCRVLDVPLAEADRLAKLVPNELKMTLDKALQVEPDLKKAYEQDERTRKVIDIGRKLEGLTRHASVHACGVVIADEPLTNFLPLYKAPGSEDLITQFEGPTVERVGLLKMDFLGLRTLSIIQRAVDLIKTLHGKQIDIERIDITDQKVFTEIFGAGRTKGVFQFESGGMADLLMKLKPDRIEDLIAANALYRPGPMALIPDFIKRKHGARWEVPHPIMREVLEETFGVMVYQEQVMRICNRLGKIPLRQAYTLIKAIGKKKEKIIKAEKARFLAGCVEQGLKERQAEEIFDLIEKFAGYGFNKSHATRYSFIAYQTAWLKCYYPVEFMAALLTFESGSTDKVVEYIGECKEMGIDVLPPDINESFTDFTVVYDQQSDPTKNSGLIRFGLGAVKGVGEKAVDGIVQARERVGRFHSLYHFCEHADLRVANKQVIEALIKAGAFDRMGGSRAQMMAGVEKAMQIGQRMQADAQSGQMNLFGAGGFGDSEAMEKDFESLPKVQPWTEMQMLTYEKEVLGMFVTKNPLSKHAMELDAYSNANTAELSSRGQDMEVVIGGMVTKIRQIVTRNGRNAGAKMAVFELQDLQGKCEVVLFPRILEQYSDLLAVDKIVFARGKVDCSRETPNVICDELIALEQASEKLAAKIWVHFDHQEVTEDLVRRVRSLCESHRGKSPLHVSVITPRGYRIMAVADPKLSVKPDSIFCEKLRGIVGRSHVELARR